MKSSPEEDRFTRLRTEHKHFIDTLKMMAYRAGSSMASLLREHLTRGEGISMRASQNGEKYAESGENVAE